MARLRKKKAHKKWAYHDTNEGNLRSIRMGGIIPSSPEEDQRPTTYFVGSLDEAKERLLGDEVVLRFPWPKDATSTGDAWDTEYVIHPRLIEVYLADGSWIALV